MVLGCSPLRAATICALRYAAEGFAFGERFTLTPELGLGLYDSVGRDYRIGWSLARPDAGESFTFSFDLTRQESANNEGTVAEHGIELRLDTQV